MGRRELVFECDTFRLPLTVERSALRAPGHPGYFFVGRRGTGSNNQDVVAKAFGDKLPKLLAAKADVRVLLFEQDSVAPYVPEDVQEYLDSGLASAAELPNEIWWLLTPLLMTDQYAHAALIYPSDRDQLADWKSGIVTSNYP
jgi:hypothetical protein